MSNTKKIFKRSVAMLLSAAMISAGGAPFTIMDALVSYAAELVPEKDELLEASDSNADDKKDPASETEETDKDNSNGGKTEEDDFDKDYTIKKAEPLKSSLKSQTMTEDEDIYEAISFPEFLTVMTMSGEELELEADWYLRDEYTEIKAGSIIYFDAELPVGYELKAGVKLPSIRVSIKAEADDGMNSDATPSQVTNATPSEIMKMNLLSENGVYEVATAEEYEKALEDIKTNETLGSEIMIVLTSDLSYKNDPYRTYPEQPLGLEGYTLTYKSDVSEGEEPYIIFQSGYYSIGAVGDVILDNVGLCADQTVNHNLTTVSSFYANGHTVEFSENFAEPIKNLYGGSSGKNVSSTHLIINGDIYKGSPSGDHMVFGGGAFKNGASKTSNGHVKGDVLIEIGPHSHASWIHGGGENSQVEGDVTIIMNGDPDDPNHQIGNITGGGVSDKDKDALSSLKGLRAGTVSGDINLYLYSGKVSSIQYGGGHNSSDVPAEDFIDNYKYGNHDSLYYATVGGDVNVTVGGGENGIFTNTTSNYNIFGSCYSVILGDLNVTINDGTDFSEGGVKEVGGIYLMGRNDTVKGAVKLTVNGGKAGDIYGLGEAWVTSPGTHVIGEYDYDDYEPDIDKLTIEVNDGEVGQITWFYSLWKQAGTWKYTDPKIYGNVKININGGTVSRVYICTPTAKGVSSLQGLSSNSYRNVPYVYGAKGIELHITGGTFSAVPSVYGLKTARVYNGQTLFFENAEEVYAWSLDHVEKIIVDNKALATIPYYRTASGTEYPSLINCGTLEIMPEGMIGLGGENTLNGDNGQVDEALIVHEGGILCLPTAQDGRPNGVLNVNGDGIANSDPDTISGFLRTVEAEISEKTIRATDIPMQPKEGEVYLRSLKTNESAPAESDANLLDLENAGNNGLYVEYTQKEEALTASDGTKYAHAWRIAQGEIPEVKKYHVVYDFKSGTKGAPLPDEVTAQLPVDPKEYAMGETVTAIQPEKTSIEGPKTPSSSVMGVWTFEGYDADEKTVSEEILKEQSGDKYIPFTGTWKWRELEEYTVQYEFISGTDGKILPDEINAYLPEDTATYKEGDSITIKQPLQTSVKVEDGTWSFQKYDKESPVTAGSSIAENGVITFTGTWIFTEDAKPPIQYDLTIDIQDMTAYTGGSSLNEDSFPAPRFKAALETRAALPEGGITLKVDGEEAGTIDDLSEVFLILGLSAEHTLEDADAPSEDDGTAGVYTISI